MLARTLPPLAALLLMAGGAWAQTPAPTPAPAPADEPLSPAQAAEELNAAVRPPPANSDADAPARIREHEERAAEALDPNNPSALNAVTGPAGPTCQPSGGTLACGTNLEVRDRPSDPATSNQTPDRDLMGRPR